MKTVIVLRVSVLHYCLHRATVAAAVALTLAAAGCSSSQTKPSTPSGATAPAATGAAAASCPTAPLAVVVSVGRGGDTVAELGGPCANVKTVLASSPVDPHEYEPAPADAALFAGAKLVVV